MLAEIKPEIKPAPAEAGRQLQTVIPPPKPPPPPKTNENPVEESMVNFGWDEIKNGFIPFVKRGSDNFVANHIVGELVYKQMEKEFSIEILCCMAIIMERMSQKEADTFNEININHSDKTLVGNYCFKPHEFMIRLEHVKKIVNYFEACRNLLLCKKKENCLFGFIQVASENQVPFVWNDDRKLVPLFYFEGQSEYLDARSIELTDPFKIGYLKFCCKVQKIKKDYYEQNPLKVVDFDDVRKLFPAETTFEVSLPMKVNQDLLAPEVRLALLHGTNEPLNVEINNNKSPASLSSGQETSDNGINLNNTENPMLANSTFERAPKRSLQSKKVEAKRQKMDVFENSFPLLPEARGTSQSLDLSRLSQDISVTPVYSPQPHRQQSNSRRNSGLSTITSAASSTSSNRDMPTLSPASNSQITNVPYRSPRGASSPGVSQVNQVINGAAQQVPEYQQTAIASSTYVINNANQQQTTVRTTGTYQPNVELHGGYVAGHGKNQLTCSSSCCRQRQSYTYAGQSESVNSLRSSVSGTTGYQPTAVQMTSIQTNNYQPAATNTAMQYQDLRLNQHLLASRPQREQYEYWQKYQQQIFQEAQRPMPQGNGFAHPTQQPRTTVLEHPQCLDATPEFYAVKMCAIKGKLLLGISKSPIAHSFLINLSECVEKALGLNPFANHTDLLSKFKWLYKLSPVQKARWDKVSHEKQLQFVGLLKDVFVDYNELLVVLRDGIRYY